MGLKGGMKKGETRRALGRGLQALVATRSAVPVRYTSATARESAVSNLIAEGESVADGSVRYTSITDLYRNPNQPRQDFSENEIAELAESIKNHGVLQPILVRSRKSSAGYEIIAGERRWRAAQQAKVMQVPVIIKDFNDDLSFEIALVENIQRADLNPVEEALAYQNLVDRLKLNQSAVAERVGKDRATVANSLRLLKLPPPVIDLLRNGKITTGHAKAILSAKEPAVQMSLAQKVVDTGLSVRALEEIVSRVVVLPASRKRTKKGATESAYPELVTRLREALGTKVTIRHTPTGAGKIEIEYFSEEELDRIAETIIR